LKDSLANALQHSREEVQATYDQRTAVEKIKMAVSLAREAAKEADIRTKTRARRQSRTEFLLLWWSPTVHCRNQKYSFHMCEPCFVRE